MHYPQGIRGMEQYLLSRSENSAVLPRAYRGHYFQCNMQFRKFLLLGHLK